ncbi:hypothetical protein E3P99_01750 [Wallemia hederae]|uniref:CST complex subunit Stn1 N-terminal domain-containing protein n=1 Tax=Wallemia hederae TaxID=1540922 RepID=A0A4T0FN20_9BASI|nr:hypothetical protein E3P99_01750 [Wallemia hederae]
MKNNLTDWLKSEQSIVELDVRGVNMAQAFEMHCKIHQQPFKQLKLFGYAMSVEYKYSKLYFSVDDGTGVILCILDSQDPPLLSVGDAVSVIGKLHTIHDTRRIYVNDIKTHRDLNDEITFINNVKQAIHASMTFTLPSINLIKQSIDADARPRKKPRPTSKLTDPSKLSDEQLTVDMFEIYLKNFIDLHSPYARISILSLKLDKRLRLLARLFHAKQDSKRGKNARKSNESKHPKLERLYKLALSNLIKKGELIVYPARPFDTRSIDTAYPPDSDEEDPVETDYSGMFEHYKTPSGPVLESDLLHVMRSMKHMASLRFIHREVTKYQENLAYLSEDSVQIGLDYLLDKQQIELVSNSGGNKYKLVQYNKDFNNQRNTHQADQ